MKELHDERERAARDEAAWRAVLTATADKNDALVLYETYLKEPEFRNHRAEAEAALETLRAPTKTTPRHQPQMVFVKDGSFQMGDEHGDLWDGCRPVHQVTVADFEIGKYPVTIGEYLAFCDETQTHYPEWLEEGSKYHLKTGSDSHYKREGIGREFENHPVVGVSWHDAQAYCEWLSQKTGTTFRLPTEAEWEFAARGGSNSLSSGKGRAEAGFKFSGSNDLDEVGWYSDNSGGKTHPVGQKKPNELGLYDMSGNVWEWCADWYGKYPSEPQTNPTGPKSGAYRVYRGGGWRRDARRCRVAVRDGSAPDFRFNYLGFRLAASPQ